MDVIPMSTTKTNIHNQHHDLNLSRLDSSFPSSRSRSTINLHSNTPDHTHPWLLVKPTFSTSSPSPIFHSVDDYPNTTNSTTLDELNSTINLIQKKKRNMSTVTAEQKRVRNLSNAFGVIGTVRNNHGVGNGNDGNTFRNVRTSLLFFTGGRERKKSSRNSVLVDNTFQTKNDHVPNRTSNGSIQTNGEDPLTLISKPPKNESDEEKQIRLKNECVAKKRSDDIDKLLREEANKVKSEKSTEKTILLLGQAEAGKTTIVKQMRMMYAPERQERHRHAWTNVIYLNLILAVKKLVNDYADSLQEGGFELSGTTSVQRVSSPVLNSLNPSRTISPEQKEQETQESSYQNGQTYSKSLLIRLRFAPLLSMEAELRRKLGTFEEPAPLRRQQANQSYPSSPQLIRKSSSFSQHETVPPKSNVSPLLLKAGWQEQILMEKGIEDSPGTNPRPSIGEMSLRKSITNRLNRSRNGDQPRRTLSNADMDKMSGNFVRKDTGQSIEKKMFCLLDASKDDVKELWRQHKVNREGIALQPTTCSLVDSSAYFLDNVNRIASANYIPTDDDILRARVRTVGVYEEHFTVDKQISYRIIDVGGSQSQRNVWAQFFFNATAIIFLAPISAFDETLSEDQETNKILDSLEIWKRIVSSPLLLRVSLILFLNKMDLLKNKLQRGIEVKQYFKKYKGTNEFEEVWRYFRAMFLLIAKEQESKAPSRNLYVHKTTATSTQEIRSILSSCQDIILRQHLRESALT